VHEIQPSVCKNASCCTAKIGTEERNNILNKKKTKMHAQIESSEKVYIVYIMYNKQYYNRTNLHFW